MSNADDFDDPRRCNCRGWGACMGFMTAEDLLCDDCRKNHPQPQPVPQQRERPRA